MDSRTALKGVIGRKLLAQVVLFSTLLALIMTAIQVYFDYRRSIDSLMVQIGQIEAVYLPIVAESLWVANSARVRFQLESILRLPNIEHVSVRPASHSQPEIAVGIQPPEDGFVREFALWYPYKGRNLELGRLHIAVSFSSIYADLRDRIVVIFATNGLKTFVVSIFILVVVHVTVTKRIFELADRVRGFDTASSNPTIGRGVGLSNEGPTDEISELNRAFHEMSIQIAGQFDRLEQHVAERTEALRSEVEQRKRAQAQLVTQSEIVTNMGEGAYLVRAGDARIVFANPKAEQMFGYDVGEMFGKHASIVYAPSEKSPEETMAEITGILERGTWSGDIENIKRDGTRFWCHVSVSTFHHPEHGEVWGFVHTDITERRSADEKIKASLREKEILLREVHHRVRNNMQVITSLLNLQERQTRNKETAEALQNCRQRIKVIATTHEKIYGCKDLTRVELSDYLSDLVGSVQQVFSTPATKVFVQTRLIDFSVSIDRAVPLGLIVSELVANALKHAFRGRDSGAVSISVEQRGANEIALVVTDDGIGIPDSLDWRNTDSLGLMITNMLAKQINGTVELDRTQGTRWSVIFGHELP